MNNIKMMDELKVIVPMKNIYTVELSDKTLEDYNKLILKDTEAYGIPCEDKKDINKCPECGTIFMRCNSYCMTCGQRVRFVDSDIVPL